MHALVEQVFGVRETPVVEPSPLAADLPTGILDELRGIVGADQVETDDLSRRTHAGGKSTSDLLRHRAGRFDGAPEVVVRPATHGEVLELLRLAARHGLAVVPFGGGTSVVGGLSVTRDRYAAVVSLDLARMNGLQEIDEVSRTATLGPGLRGPAAEALLAEYGFTLGHFPQSFERATIGGFAATRSSGQSSAGYGRFDALVVGLTVATPRGTLRLGQAPASAAGPDLRQLILGSEGAFGVVTSVRVRIRPRPSVIRDEGWRFESFAEGAAAMRRLAQDGPMPTVLRLSDADETALNLSASGQIGDGGNAGCLMIVGVEETTEDRADSRAAEVARVLSDAGGTTLGPEPVRAWREGRFSTPYLRDGLLDLGVLAESLDTATFWSDVLDVHAAVRSALLEALGERALVLAHISHVYETGCSLYFTVAAPQEDDPVAQWWRAKTAAGEAIIAAGATITHHHGVGSDHRAWLGEEIGEIGVDVLRAVKAELDPDSILNPGILVP